MSTAGAFYTLAFYQAVANGIIDLKSPTGSPLGLRKSACLAEQ